MESPVRGAVARTNAWFLQSITAMKAHKVPPHHVEQLLKTQVTWAGQILIKCKGCDCALLLVVGVVLSLLVILILHFHL